MRIQVRSDKSVEAPVELWLEPYVDGVMVKVRRGDLTKANNLLVITEHGVTPQFSVDSGYGFKLDSGGRLRVRD